MPNFWIAFDRQEEREVRQHAEVAIEAPSEAEARAAAQAMLANPGQIPWEDIRVLDERLGDPELWEEIEPVDEDDADDGSILQDELVELYADAKHGSGASTPTARWSPRSGGCSGTPSKCSADTPGCGWTRKPGRKQGRQHEHEQHHRPATHR